MICLRCKDMHSRMINIVKSVSFQTKQGKKSLQEPWRIDDGQSDLTNKTSSTEIQLIATTET